MEERYILCPEAMSTFVYSSLIDLDSPLQIDVSPPSLEFKVIPLF